VLGTQQEAPVWFDLALQRARDCSSERQVPAGMQRAFSAIEHAVAVRQSKTVLLQAGARANAGGEEAARGGRYWSIAHHPEQATYYGRVVASTPNISNVCEVGFNAGHSTAIWLSSNPAARTFTFDIGTLDYTPRAMRKMQRLFGGRFNVFVGPSELTVPLEAPQILRQMQKTKLTASAWCDLLHVDGDHDTMPTYNDFFNMFSSGMARCNQTLVLMDDVCDLHNCHCRTKNGRPWSPCHGPSRALQLMTHLGLMTILDKHFGVADRGWVLAAPTCQGAHAWPHPCDPSVWRDHFHITERNFKKGLWARFQCDDWEAQMRTEMAAPFTVL